MRTTADLRKYLQTIPDAPKDYRVAVGSMIFTPEDKVILIERGEKARDAAGKLEGIGGGVDVGETDLHRALEREIQEEIGHVRVEIDDVLTVKILPGSTGGYWVVVDYLCRLLSGTPEIMEREKMKKIHYLQMSEIDETRLSYYQKVAIDAYKKRYGLVPFYKVQK